MATHARRVLMTTDTVGGVWTYAVDLCRELDRHGVQVVLATMGRPLDAGQRRQVEAVPSLEVRESSYALEWMEDPWEDVARAGDWLLALEEEVAPDVVHLNGYAHGALPFQAPRLMVAHSCVCSWWEAVLGEEAPARYDRYRQAVRDGLQGADVVVAPTRAMLSALERHHGPLGEARVIPNGVRLDAFRPGRCEPYVLAAGRLWDQAKNLAILERLAPRIPWPIRVAGDTAPPGERSKGCRTVAPLGRLPHEALVQQMSNAAIFAHPARYEPFGLAPLEAAASGCALVLGDIPSLREVWGDAACFVPPDDLEALDAAVEDLIACRERRERLAARARRRAAHFDVARTGERYLALHRELMPRPARSEPALAGV